MAFGNGPHTATVWLTVLVTFNRFKSVCKPVGVMTGYTFHVKRFQVIVVVIFSVIYNLPRLFEHHVIQHMNQPIRSGNNSNKTAAFNSTKNKILGDDNIYQIIYPTMYIFPLGSLAYLNVKLIWALNEMKSRKKLLTGRAVKEDHITKCIIALVCVFIVCQTPALVNQIFWAVLSMEERQCGYFHFYFTKVSDVLVVFNSAVNFAIYCLFSRSFRAIFVQACICRPHFPRKSSPSFINDKLTNNKSSNDKLTNNKSKCAATVLLRDMVSFHIED